MCLSTNKRNNVNVLGNAIGEKSTRVITFVDFPTNAFLLRIQRIRSVVLSLPLKEYQIHSSFLLHPKP